MCDDNVRIPENLFKQKVSSSINRRIKYLENQIWDTYERVDELKSLKKELKLDNENKDYQFLVKELMKIEHEQWIYWSKGIALDLQRLLSLMDLEEYSGEDLDFIISQLDRLDRWKHLWNMDYDDYDGDKSVEREYVNKTLNILYK